MLGFGIDVMQDSFLLPLFSRFQNLESVNSIEVVCYLKVGRINTRSWECAVFLVKFIKFFPMITCGLDIFILLQLVLVIMFS